MEDCIFCKIVRGEIPARKVFEDERIIAFEDINPQAPVHILIIPKEHYESLNAVPEGNEDVLGHILNETRKIAAERGLKESGYRVVLNTGRDSGQDVLHIHFHLLGGRRMAWPPG